MNWNEAGNFSPDGVNLVLSGSTEKDAQGTDIYVLNIRTGELANLTHSPTVWDEHGRFSPDGQKIMLMSAYPYRADPNASKVMSIKTEFMLMNKDGSGFTQLTHFREPGYPEYPSGIAANPEWAPDGGSASLGALIFPNYEYWDLVFQGPCGGSPERR
jgi:Tol biopolymer transport system component